MTILEERPGSAGGRLTASPRSVTLARFRREILVSRQELDGETAATVQTVQGKARRRPSGPEDPTISRPPPPPAPPRHRPPLDLRRSRCASTSGVSKPSSVTITRRRELFESVLRQYPEEKELHERVRLYLNICQRQATREEPAPQTIEERLFASTLAINGGRYDEAISHLHLVRDEDPDNDHALYMLAVAHAQRGEHAEASPTSNGHRGQPGKPRSCPPRSRSRAASRRRCVSRRARRQRPHCRRAPARPTAPARSANRER